MRTKFVYCSNGSIDELINKEIDKIQSYTKVEGYEKFYGKVIDIKFSCSDEYDNALILWEYL
jgi:hypothetical protein